MVPRGCLQFVIVVFPDHTQLLFLTYHEFLPIILWETDIVMLYINGLEIIVVVLTMIFLETMFVITRYVNGVA